MFRDSLSIFHVFVSWLYYKKSSLYICIKYIGFVWVKFYGISTIVGYLMSNPLSTYILNIYDLFGLGFMGISTIVGYLMSNPLSTYILNIYDLFCLDLWHINHCWLFNAKSSLHIYIYIKYIYGLVGFYGISTIIGYFMSNPLYTYIY